MTSEKRNEIDRIIVIVGAIDPDDILYALREYGLSDKEIDDYWGK